MDQNKKRIRLDEITLMRSVLAVLIVFMHAFTCYQGAWEQPEGYIDIPVYKWIARISFAFTLEAFVFISGYLFAFQRITLNKIEGGFLLIKNKSRRLLLPSIVFSVLYFALFYDHKGIGNLIYNIINGCGHMWFLPMLFWCYIGGWLLEQVKIGDGWKLLFLVCLYLFWPIPLPLQLTVAANFLVYFYGGYIVYKHSEQIKALITPRRIAICWLAFVVAFVVFRPLKETLVIGDPSKETFQMLTSSVRDLCRLIYASIGIISFYITAVWYAQRRKLKPFTVKFAGCCFGIYLFQQFILQLLYYKTSLPVLVGPYWLPWVGFLLALPISYLFTLLLLKTKTGKYLIG